MNGSSKEWKKPQSLQLVSRSFSFLPFLSYFHSAVPGRRESYETPGYIDFTSSEGKKLIILPQCFFRSLRGLWIGLLTRTWNDHSVQGDALLLVPIQSLEPQALGLVDNTISSSKAEGSWGKKEG